MKRRMSRIPCYDGSKTTCNGLRNGILGISQNPCKAVEESGCYIRVALAVLEMGVSSGLSICCFALMIFYHKVHDLGCGSFIAVASVPQM